jgi:hypothetical protein
MRSVVEKFGLATIPKKKKQTSIQKIAYLLRVAAAQ